MPCVCSCTSNRIYAIWDEGFLLYLTLGTSRLSSQCKWQNHTWYCVFSTFLAIWIYVIALKLIECTWIMVQTVTLVLAIERKLSSIHDFKFMQMVTIPDTITQQPGLMVWKLIQLRGLQVQDKDEITSLEGFAREFGFQLFEVSIWEQSSNKILSYLHNIPCWLRADISEPKKWNNSEASWAMSAESQLINIFSLISQFCWHNLLTASLQYNGIS